MRNACTWYVLHIHHELAQCFYVQSEKQSVINYSSLSITYNLCQPWEEAYCNVSITSKKHITVRYHNQWVLIINHVTKIPPLKMIIHSILQICQHKRNYVEYILPPKGVWNIYIIVSYLIQYWLSKAWLHIHFIVYFLKAKYIYKKIGLWFTVLHCTQVTPVWY